MNNKKDGENAYDCSSNNILELDGAIDERSVDNTYTSSDDGKRKDLEMDAFTHELCKYLKERL